MTDTGQSSVLDRPMSLLTNDDDDNNNNKNNDNKHYFSFHLWKLSTVQLLEGTCLEYLFHLFTTSYREYYDFLWIHKVGW